MALSETLYGKTPEQLAAVCAELGMPRFAAKQLARWLYAKHVEDPMRMSDIAAAHRAKLAERFRPAFTPPARITESADGTKKYLYRTQQGAWIESAYIPDGERATLCVSSQAGCRMGCKFCATGRQGLQHSLTTAEILNQIVSLPERDSLTNVVFMGMGEPLLNLKNVMRALESLNNDKGLNFSPRRITVSTCGIEKGLRELGESGLAYLAVSLHAPTQELRARIMPKAARWPLEDLLQALKSYPLKTRERITFEYLLLGGVNDGLEQARQLARVVSDVKGKLNLIVYNPSEGDPYKAPSPERVLAFEQYLWDRNITAIIRKSKGQDIKAACGQLKAARQNEAGEQA